MEKLTVGGYQISISGFNRLLTDSGKPDQSIRYFLNELSLYCDRAGDYYTSVDSPEMAAQARHIASDLYAYLRSKGFYDERG